MARAFPGPGEVQLAPGSGGCPGVAGRPGVPWRPGIPRRLGFLGRPGVQGRFVVLGRRRYRRAPGLRGRSAAPADRGWWAARGSPGRGSPGSWRNRKHRRDRGHRGRRGRRGHRGRQGDRGHRGPGGRGRLVIRSRSRRCSKVRQLLLQVGDRDVALAHRLGDLVQGLVGYLHVVAPHGGGRPEQRDVRRGYRAEVERGVVGLLIGQFAAPAGRGEEDADENHGDRDEEYNRHIRIVPCSVRDVASVAQRAGNCVARTGRDGGARRPRPPRPEPGWSTPGTTPR